MKPLTMYVVLAIAFCVLFPIPAYATGFGEYEGGLLKIEPPRVVKIYKKGTMTAKVISIGATQYAIQDARWQGSELVVTLVEKNGRQAIRVYKDTTSYRTVS